MPPVSGSKKLFKSIEFWSGILVNLDKQFQFMEENFCYGKISLEFKFWGGKMTDKTSSIIVNDKILKENKSTPLDKA